MGRSSEVLKELFSAVAELHIDCSGIISRHSEATPLLAVMLGAMWSVLQG